MVIFCGFQPRVAAFALCTTQLTYTPQARRVLRAVPPNEDRRQSRVHPARTQSGGCRTQVRSLWAYAFGYRLASGYAACQLVTDSVLFDVSRPQLRHTQLE